MDSVKFTALLEAVSCGSLTAAAEKMGYTQTGLTHMMKRLENEMGFALLHRQKSGITLTREGEKLLPQMRAFVQSAHSLEQAARRVTDGKDARIRIGSYTSILKLWLPELINGFRKQNPEVHFDIRDQNLTDIYSNVESGDLDVGFGSRMERTGCSFVHLYDDPLCAVIPAGERTDSVFPVSEFNGRPFLMPSYGFDPDVLRVLEENRVTPVEISASVDDAAVVSLVSMGLGCSMLSELVLQGVYNTDICILPVVPSARRELGMILPHEKSANSLVRKFIRFSETELRKKQNM